MNNKHSTGFLHLIFPAMLFLMALSTVVSNRDFTVPEVISMTAPVRPPLVAWVQRGISLLLLLASTEQIVNHFALGRRVPSPALLGTFILYWLCTVASPGLFGANPVMGHEYVYSLVVGMAVCLLGKLERDRILNAARDTLMLLMLAGLAFIPFKLNMVLDTMYGRGIIPGLPRFAGLMPHAVTQGMLAQVALIVLWCKPYEHRWINRWAWALGLGVLFIAQSKTTWIGFAACLGAMVLVTHGGRFWQHLSDPRRSGFGILMCLVVIALVLTISGWILLGNLAGQAEDFANSPQGAQLISLTGRDQIWAAALEEWRNNRTFGYGLTLWDEAYRASIGMPYATHAHNQFLDDLARSGTVGAIALVIYFAVLLVLSLRYARATGGLSVGLFMTMAIRAFSEVPLSLLNYGTELFPHLLLLVTLAAAASVQRTAAAPAPAPLRYGVAS